MTRTENFLSSPGPEERLLLVPLTKIHPHPLNANVMSEERLVKLTENIRREGRYPPLIVRPHPDLYGEYQLLDGHQRLEAVHSCGYDEAVCYEWPCDDVTALTLLATLNRLEGEDVPARRAQLLTELTRLVSPADLALLLPENAAEINDTINLIALDADELLAKFTAAAAREEAQGPRLVSFALSRDDEADVEKALAQVMASLDGPNRRGRALGIIARHYAEMDPDG